MSSFYIENFGCRATQADGAAIDRQFRDQGLQRADVAGRAEYVVLNTCAVTASAEQDARAAVRRIRRQNPDCKIVMTGCYAQRAPAEVAALAGVSHVIGNSHKHTLAQITLAGTPETNLLQNPEFIPVSDLQRSGNGYSNSLVLAPAATDSAAQQRNLDGPAAEYREIVSEGTEGSFSGRRELADPKRSGRAEIFVSDIFAHTELVAAPVFDSSNERTRPNLKIQDGCNNRCSFCIIPSVRGRSRSLDADQVIREVNQLVDAGYREIVLSGINLGRWGRDLSGVPHFSRSLREVGPFRAPRTKFEDLIRLILDHTSIEKLRISSVEPMDWSDSLIRLVAGSPRIAKHAHLPLQSGSDAVLRRMHRKYRPWHYREKIETIRVAMPKAAIGADVMVGFPGETAAEFEETRRFIEELPFTYLHVFTFSARPGTPAAVMPNQIPVHVARMRNRILRELASAKKLAFMRSFVGRELQAITLNVTSEEADGTWTEALSDNYLKVKMKGRLEPNRWIAATIVDVEDGELLATTRHHVEKSCA